MRSVNRLSIFFRPRLSELFCAAVPLQLQMCADGRCLSAVARLGPAQSSSHSRSLPTVFFSFPHSDHAFSFLTSETRRSEKKFKTFRKLYIFNEILFASSYAYTCYLRIENADGNVLITVYLFICICVIRITQKVLNRIA